MHRVYSKEENKWVKDEVYVSPLGDMYILKKSISDKIGFVKLQLISSKKNILQNAIGIKDKNNISIYDGDICKCTLGDGREVFCVVGYSKEHASYLFFDYAESVYYSISEEFKDAFEVVGNVFDAPELIEYNDESDQ